MRRGRGGVERGHERMRHVFVETNWVYAYAAPAHHKRLDAVDLLRRAMSGEIKLHLPSACLAEAQQSIVRKCQPRGEADAIRRYLIRARTEQAISPEQERSTREVLDRFEQQVRSELRALGETLDALRDEASLEIFPLNDAMLLRSVALSTMDLFLKPFDQAILAAILVRAEELRSAGEDDLGFCEIDSDLQPWDKRGEAKTPLVHLYDATALWVYGDFDMRAPERPNRWPAQAETESQ